ncbi:GntR family transcriptional regulator [Nonomuraea turcica]|uniref:GntR family transcriptional regulator n=1 Tax=Nonomuraea sp. G32 TaxID=3067274 RepID=UPI00273B09C9|nr:GntR family transcriptional regulator [Nonomuraea sp. G32]MDP4507017.1 GntR family transcriptional regulator [Nonomuraea sp. G32]
MPKHADKRPRHQQIAADLRALIMAGTLPRNTQIPSTQQLVDKYDAANATIQRALTILKNEGYLYGVPGKGVFVRDKQPFVIDVAAYFAPSPEGFTYKLIDVREVQPPVEVADALGIAPNETAILRHRLLLHAGEPIELSWSYYPASIAAGTPLAERKRIRGGAPQALADLGYPQQNLTDQISTRPPTPEEVEGLELPEEVPVIRQFRVIYSNNMQPVEASILVKGGHLYELKYKVTTT